MTTPLARTTSDTARLLVDPPGYAIGWQQRVYVPSPAAGAAWSRTIPGPHFERLVAARWVLTTSAVVANRFPVLYLTDPNGVKVLCVWAGGTNVASQVSGINLAREYSLQSNYGGIETFGPMPDLLLPPGFTWTATCQNMDVGDTQTGIVLTIDQFPNDITRISASDL